MILQASQLRAGNCILHNGEPHVIRKIHHSKMARQGAIIQANLRSLKTGSQAEHRFRSDDKVEKAILNTRVMQYLYQDNDHYVFMDTENYEQIHLEQSTLDQAIQFLVPESTIEVQFFEESPVGIELPSTVELRIVDTEPGLKGATAANSPKPATMETGLVVQVPPFVNKDETIRVDTGTGNYVERVKK